MARIYVKRLIDKYGKSNVTKKKYQSVINDILTINNQNITRQVGKLTSNKLETQLKRTMKSQEEFKKIKFPTFDDIAPSKEINVKKQAIRGQMITQTLRDRLNKDLRQSLTLKTYNERLTKKQVEDFKKRIVSTFNEYTVKTNGETPSNIQVIATTELRSAANDIRDAYVKELIKKNPDIEYIKKTWQHNDVSKNPRHGHKMLHGVSMKLDEPFKLTKYKKVGNRLLKNGTVFIQRPHDIDAPADEVIGCNCELKYSIKMRG